MRLKMTFKNCRLQCLKWCEWVDTGSELQADGLAAENACL